MSYTYKPKKTDEPDRCKRCHSKKGTASITLNFENLTQGWIDCGYCIERIEPLSAEEVDRLRNECDHDKRLKLAEEMIRQRGLVPRLGKMSLRFPCYDEDAEALQRGRQRMALQKQIDEVFKKSRFD